MKTKEQIQLETKCAKVFTSDELWDLVLDHKFYYRNGYGYFHDGETETSFSAREGLNWSKNYPFVCWYNK